MSSSFDSFSSWLRTLQGGKPPSGVPDVNLIPAQYAKIPVFSRNSTLALIVVVELMFAIILFQTYGDQSLKTLGFREVAPVIVPEHPLTVQIRQTRTQRNGLVNAHSSITGQSINWPELLDLIFNSAPDRIKSISFQQAGQQLTLSGTAGAHANVFEYESILTDSPHVAKATAGSITGSGDNVTFIFNVALNTGVKVE